MTTHTSITWSFIRQFNFSNPPKIVLGRSEDIDTKYKEDIHIIKANGGALKHLTKKYLSNENDYNMTLNNYPYYMEDGVVHYVIWFKGDKFYKYNNPPAIENIIKDYITHNNIYSRCDYVYYQNIEELRSIPSIPHLHVFMKIA
jgi:hypothetical protein